MNTFLGVVRFDGASIGEDELRKLAERTDFPGGGALSSGSFWGAISDPPPRTLPECENVSLFSDLLLCNGEEVARSIGARSNDEETIFLEAYQHYGEGFASRFVGDFSFAIIEESNRRLLLGRDAVGVKSLFLARERDGLFFSNDFGTLAKALGERLTLDPFAIAHFSTLNQAFIVETIYKEIMRTKPGETISFTPEGTRTIENWRPRSCPPLLLKKEEYYEAAREVVERAVRERTREDSKTSVLLSGGVDSSIVAATLYGDPELKKRSAPAAGYFTDGKMSLGYTDEAKRVTMLEEMHNFQTYRYVANNDSDPFELVEDYIEEHRNIPDVTVLPVAPCFRAAAAEGAKMIFSGFGGDQFISNYGADAASLSFISGNWATACRLIREEAAFLNDNVRSVFRRRILYRLTPPPILHWYADRSASRFSALKASPFRDDILSSFSRQQDKNTRGPNFSSDRPIWGGREGVAYNRINAGLERWDDTARSYGLTISHPLLDRRVIEFAVRAPARVKHYEGVPRALALRAFFDVLPPDFFRRIKKTPAYPDYVSRILKNKRRYYEQIHDLSETSLAFAFLDRSKLVSAINELREAQTLNPALEMAMARIFIGLPLLSFFVKYDLRNK